MNYHRKIAGTAGIKNRCKMGLKIRNLKMDPIFPGRY